MAFGIFVVANEVGDSDKNVVDGNDHVCTVDDVNGNSICQKELQYADYPWFKHYMKLYNDMLVDQIMDPQFVVFKKHKHAMGWGNRLRAKLSVFILGLATDRLFLQDHQMFTDNFDPPLVPTKDGKLLVPLQWDFEEQSNFCEAGGTIHFDNKELEEVGITRPVDPKRKMPQVSTYLDWLKEEDIIEPFKDFDCIIYDQPASFDARIYVNKLYKKKLKKLFGTRSRMERMRQVFRFLTSRPSRNLLDASNSLANSLGFYNYEPSYRVGLQVRMFFDREVLQKRLWDGIEDSYLPCVEKMLTKKLKTLGLKPNTNEDSVVPPLLIYLTTDDEKFRPFLRDKLKKYGEVVFSNEEVVHTSKISQSGTNPAIIEWFMLGMTSSVMTTGSSFGVMAWGIEGELKEIIGTPHKSWGPRLCGPYPIKKLPKERDISWGHGGNW